MNIILTGTSYLWRWTLRLAGLLLILAALLLPLGRLLSTQLDAYRAEVEQGVSDYLGAPVQIQHLKVTWQGWTPTLRLDGFYLTHPADQVLQADFQRVWVSPALLDSLLSGRWVLNNIHLEGLRLVLQRDDDDLARLKARLQALAAWLLRIRSLDVVFQEWELQPANSTGPPLVFHDLRLSLRDHPGSRRLDLAVQLPETLGSQLQAAGEWRGDGNDPRTWKVTFYLRGNTLNWADWPLPVKPAAGRISRLELWGEWQKQALQTLRGKATLQALPPPDLPATSELRKRLADGPEFTTVFSWQPTAAGWQLYSNWTGIDKKGSTALHSVVELSLLTPAGTTQYFEGRGRDLRLQDLVVLALPWLDASQRNRLAELNPRGQVPEWLFRIPLDQAYAPLPPDLAPQGGGYALAARLQQLATRTWQNLPGIQGLSGYLTLDQDSGRLELETGSLRVDAANLWRAPLTFDSLRGPVQWRRDTTGLRLESPGITLSRAAFNVHLQGNVTLFDDGSSPQLELGVQWANLDVGQVRQYLPATLLEPRLVSWLDRSLVSGRVPAGELVWRGRLAEFPFDKGQGLFETRFKVLGTILDYDPAWPHIEDLEAKVVFRNRSFQVEALGGRIWNADLQRVQAGIADLEHPVLDIQGQAKAPGATLLRLLRESPLAAKAGMYVKGMRLTGDHTLELNLHIPLDPRPNTVQGMVHFTGGNLTLTEWNLELQRLQGNLGFTEAGLTAKELRLLWHDEPVRMDIDTDPQPGGDTRFHLYGQLSLRALAGSAADALAPYAEGRGQWDAVLAVPPGRLDTFTLELASDLEGIQVKLPPPLAKPAATSRPFSLHARLDHSAELQLQLHYEPDTQAVLEIVAFPEQPRFSRGELRINSGAARLPKAPGLAVVAHLPRLTLAAPAPLTLRTPLVPSWLSTLDARLDELVIGKQSFAQVAVSARQRDDRLTVALDSQTLAGRLALPTLPGRETPLEIELQRLLLNTNEQVPELNADDDPRALPPLQITVDKLSLNGTALGSLRLSTTPRPDGLRVNELQLQSDLEQLTAGGDWLITAAGPVSHLEARLKSKALGKTLQAFGYKVMEGGKTEAELKVNWPAPLPAVSPERWRGTLHLHIGKGQLTEVEPGVGRLVGLVNLFSLMRRLRMDFSDLFGQGLSFDHIDGDFTFADGQVHTDMTLETPPARIRIDGPVNLKDRTYQQTVTVTPHISSPLAIAGTIIAGSNPVGAAVFLAGQLLKPGIERLARYQYAITGSWDNPVIERKVVPADTGAPSKGWNQ
jgi:uncharacterized protein (TIGR02099 family)